MSLHEHTYKHILFTHAPKLMCKYVHPYSVQDIIWSVPLFQNQSNTLCRMKYINQLKVSLYYWTETSFTRRRSDWIFCSRKHFDGM